MPCWIVQTVSVEFQAKHVDLLIEAIERLKLKVSSRGGLISIDYGLIEINLETGKANFEDRTKNYNLLNKIKRSYSMTTIEEAARKKKWVIKRNQKSPGKLKLKKW